MSKNETDPDEPKVTVEELVGALEMMELSETMILEGILENYGTDHVILYRGKSYSAIKIKADDNKPALKITEYDGTAKDLADLTGRSVGVDVTSLDGHALTLGKEGQDERTERAREATRAG